MVPTEGYDPAAWMISQFADTPGESATLAALATLVEPAQRAAFAAQYVLSRNGCAWADGTGDGSQWSPDEVAQWSRKNPVNAAELERLTAEDAQIAAAPTVTAQKSLRDRLIVLHGLEADASDDEIFAAADDIYRRWSMEFS